MVDATLPSPCLFGFFRPKVYLTPICTKDETHLRHVLTHELTHYAHKDHIWSLVRCVCLCVYWFNPLVWIAAGLAKRDCELACDEAVLKKLGDEERISYGKTLVDMVANSNSPAHYLETATAMYETKKALKERVNHIMKKHKHLFISALSLILVLFIATGCVFTGANLPTEPNPTDPPTTTAPPETTVPPTTESLDNEQARYLEAFHLVDENGYEGEAGQKLCELCYTDIEKFLHYASQVIDPHNYDSYESFDCHAYKWAVSRHATDAERALLKETCLDVFQDPSNSFELRFAASLLAPLDNKEARAMRAAVLEHYTEIPFQSDIAIIEIDKTTGYAPQYYPTSWLYTSYDAFLTSMEYHKQMHFYDGALTNDLCPQSNDQLLEKFDEAFFRDSILMRMEIAAVPDKVPLVTKVSVGDPNYWVDRFCVYLEYETDRDKENQIFVAFIAVPRSYYRLPTDINSEGTPFSFVINGVPFQIYG